MGFNSGFKGLKEVYILYCGSKISLLVDIFTIQALFATSIFVIK